MSKIKYFLLLSFVALLCGCKSVDKFLENGTNIGYANCLNSNKEYLLSLTTLEKLCQIKHFHQIHPPLTHLKK